MNTDHASRLAPLDTLRGLLIGLMIVEHARQILGGGVLLETHANPIPALSTNVASLIRLVSHLCAPGFFFLLGIGILLKLEHHSATLRKAQWRFFKRGLLLILLQVTVEDFGWGFPILWRAGPEGCAGPLYLGVLFGLGASLIVTAALLHLPSIGLLVLAISMIASSLLPFPPALHPWIGWLTSGYFGTSVEVLYPVLPWSGITLLGVLFARHLLRHRQFHPALFRLSTLAALAGVMLWTLGCLAVGGAALSGWYKYPPSPSYVLGTLAFLLLLLVFFAAVPAANLRPLQMLGRHALGIYLAHLYLLGIISLLVYRPSMTQTLVIAAGVGLLGAGWYHWRERRARATPVGNCFDRCFRFYDPFIRRSGFDRTAEIRRTLTGVRAQGELLDVGGGTGYLASQLADLFSRIVVVDSSAGMLSVAAQRNLQTCQASALALPFAPAQFDVVLCSDALHHIKQAEQALAEMYRVLKPGGMIVILEFHIRGLAGWLLFAFERLFLEHSEFITPDRLQTLLEQHGVRGGIHRISRLQYLYVGQKPVRSSVT